MLSSLLPPLLPALAFLAYRIGRSRAERAGDSLIAIPHYHGLYAAVLVAVPGAVLLVSASLLQGAIDRLTIFLSLPDTLIAGENDGEIDLMVAKIAAANAGVFTLADPHLIAVAESVRRRLDWVSQAPSLLCLPLIVAGGALALRRIGANFQARDAVERLYRFGMIAVAGSTVAVTLGVALTLIHESISFFRLVSPIAFLFGLDWDPQIPLRPDQHVPAHAFGSIPVFQGALMIAAISLFISVPLSLAAAVYLTQYAAPRSRALIKPALEWLAGVPTIVYGFFAALIVAPVIADFGRDVLGVATAANSAMAAGIVMAIMVLPLICSLSDDALNAVPKPIKDGSYALGATTAETVFHILIPAALPGIVSGILLGFSRAIGETMIVVMAAGTIAVLTLNPMEAVTTATVQIVALLTGDTEFDNPRTLAAYALGLTLFILTLIVNSAAFWFLRRRRQARTS